MRNTRPRPLGLIATFVLIPAMSIADDLTGSEEFLCTAWHAARCTAANGTCEATESWRLNMPDFVRLDLNGKVIATTAAHEQDRNTPIDAVQRRDGLILLHGAQGERAWSWVINEASGEGTMTISAKGDGITVFSTCTPIDGLVKEGTS